MNQGVQPKGSYRVLVDKKGHLLWLTETDGKQIIYRSEPEANTWKKMKSGFIQLLPVELQL
jgi:hypothetical protein